MADIQKLNVNGNTYDISTTWTKVTGKPSTFTPSSHTHPQYLTSALRPAKLFTGESLFPPGYFIITINNNNSKWILSFDVKIVVSDGSYTIRFSENNSTKSESWYRPSASMIDGEDSVKVKFGYRRTNKWVAIPAPDSLVGISITNVANGYAPIDTYALDKLFTIDFFEDWGVLEGDDSGLGYLGTVQETITIYPPSKSNHTHTFASLTSKPTTINGYGITDALTTSNYNSYVPTRTGTGASGTWGINISGNAASAGYTTRLYANSTGDLVTIPGEYSLSYSRFQAGASNIFPVVNNANGCITAHLHPGNYYTQIGLSSNGRMYYRTMMGQTLDSGVSWNTVAFTSDIPSSLPASDVYAWAKASTKPTYTYSEVGAAPASHSHSYLPLSGGTLTGSITMSQPSSNRRVGIIGTYDPNRAAAIWSMGSSYQIAADGLSFGSLYGAAYAYYGSGYTFGAGKSGGHSFVWCQNGAPSAALGNNVWTSGGFIKNGSSNSYVLLGGGGHKAESSLSVNYANSAGSAPASDVYAWAKASSKPTYTYSEVGAAAASHTHNYAGSSSAGGAATSVVVTDSNANSNYRMVWHSGNSLYSTDYIYCNPSTDYLYSKGFYQTSDKRLKTFYEPIKPDLEKLRKLRKNYFKFNDKDKLEIGVSAQEIQSIYPEIVSENSDGYLSVAYDKLSVIALAAIDELDDKILQLANKISTLENILNKLMGEKGVN